MAYGRLRVLFFCKAPATTQIYTLSLHDALPILQQAFAELGAAQCGYCTPGILLTAQALLDETPTPTRDRSEEHTSELQSRENLVCRLLLEKKKKIGFITSRSLPPLAASCAAGLT